MTATLDAYLADTAAAPAELAAVRLARHNEAYRFGQRRLQQLANETYLSIEHREADAARCADRRLQQLEAADGPTCTPDVVLNARGYPSTEEADSIIAAATGAPVAPEEPEA